MDGTERGMEIADFIGVVRDSEYIVKRNYEELDSIFEYHADEIDSFKDSPGELAGVMREFLRRLHNYTASVYALTEHSQTVRKKIDNRKFSSNYNRKLEELKLKKRGKFIKELRNYIQHYRTPKTASVQELGQEEDKVYMTINRDKLLEWGEFNQKITSYIENKEEEIKIEEEIKSYHESLLEFYSWFYDSAIEKQQSIRASQ